MSLQEVFGKLEGYVSDKWLQYLVAYDRELAPIVARGNPVTLLEIGIQNGGSLNLWHQFLPPGSRIIGIDIDERCRTLSFPAAIETRIVDAGDVAALTAALGDETFDVIIDDGSHTQVNIAASLGTLLPRLRGNGLYFVEDLHCSYWASHGGGFRLSGSGIERLKAYIDGLNLDYIALAQESNVGPDEQHALEFVHAEIARISFYDSMAVLERYPTAKTVPCLRGIGGTEMAVTGTDGLVDAIARNPFGFAFSESALRQFEAPIIQRAQAAASHFEEVAADLRRRLEACDVELAAVREQRDALRSRAISPDNSAVATP